ncbi:TorD/DmsD family molecular chaperone [Aromatoleum aromaticum]|uniref:Cytoplasmic 'private chaperone' of TorD family, probably for assembly of Mo-cofactor in formate dehydrogenase n=1 Tax=Aromatoleum aromaticum (strain DSM 19018 / LMG 30748 / EbN1) TaxID=76114 RepID=Q5P4I6_AROAE|nr:molecular chaperone TorD family protein [Aromatoleum aromaticum]NMG53552.1 molecular chaperone [Aromatoleum aromaticum]CAI07777.1 cytoplasmic 'private chaperone' of TorD family, probably for assembly of Mo-cofactor in formate dehydrogenase [Aromatoleum aromaticum EbN1]
MSAPQAAILREPGFATSASLPASAEDAARAEHYALLARLFLAAPDAPLLAALVAAGDVFGVGDSSFGVAWAELAEAARRTDARSVRDEYEALFQGIGRPEVMLYGSFYLAGFLMEEPLADLRDDLAGLGLARRGGVTETEDHVAALAEVMRHLVVSGADAAGLARQRAFFTRHLQPWYARLADAVAAAPQASFYARVGALARAFFDVESEAFAMD